MIAKYNDIYCCIDDSTTPTHLWTYVPADGFQKQITHRGTVYYEKYVNNSEIDEIFDVAFSVKWKDMRFGCEYSPKTEQIILFCSNKNIAQKYNFNQFERGCYSLCVNIHECKEFQILYYDNADKNEEKQVSLDEWKNLWNQYIANLLPN